ncbi:MAG: Disulfide bond formation protein B [Chlamydiae bacterium]|nr:Disulfide bond formation protein B [Chlamydiota bacterium]
MKSIVRNGNALLILVLMGVIASAFFQEFTKEGPPCPLCFLQRIGMIGVATGAMMNLCLGVRIQHYAFSFLSAGIGGAVSVQQILIHICPDSPVFGIPILGYGLYTWAFIVFCCSILALITFLLFYRSDQKKKARLNWLGKLAIFALILITLADLALALVQCGLHPCPDPSWPQPKVQTS